MNTAQEIEVKPKKRTHVRPGFVRRPETCLLKTREALYLPMKMCFKDDSGSYHIPKAYVILREDWEDYHDFLFAPTLEALLNGKFVAQLVSDWVVSDVLEKVYIPMSKIDFLEMVKNHLETE